MGGLVSPTENEKGMPSSDVSMLDALGSGRTSSGSELDSPTGEFEGRSMNPGALGSSADEMGTFPSGNVLKSPCE